MDADDTVDADWLKIMIDAQNETNADIVCTGFKKFRLKNNRLVKARIYIPPKKKFNDKPSINNELQTLINSIYFNSLWNKLYNNEIIKKL